MDNISTRNGLFAGISAIIIGLVIYLISPMGFLSWGGWITIIPVVYFMVAAAKIKREEGEGFISLRSAFTASWLVYLLYSLISVLFTYVMMNIVDPSLIDTAKQVSIEAIEKMSGLIGEQGTEAAIKELENNNPYSLGNIFFGFLMTLVFPGALIALVIALFVKREKPENWA